VTWTDMEENTAPSPPAVPEAYASAEQDRDHRDVHVVDDSGSRDVADDGGTPPMRSSWPSAASRGSRAPRQARRRWSGTSCPPSRSTGAC